MCGRHPCALRSRGEPGGRAGPRAPEGLDALAAAASRKEDGCGCEAEGSRGAAGHAQRLWHLPAARGGAGAAGPVGVEDGSAVDVGVTCAVSIGAWAHCVRVGNVPGPEQQAPGRAQKLRLCVYTHTEGVPPAGP